ncbi:MAG: SUMF1/EgtB/PvdO family nonheme iron enzyme [Acidobacteria bacterium]|nr:SUMF1/EgtB/PvdO family nonheme iron enzyme [Acidobacteriota bacterium]
MGGAAEGRGVRPRAHGDCAGRDARHGGDDEQGRGGSWFCSPNYCGAYRPGFRGKSPPASAFNNVGFRCARDAKGSTSGR